MARITIDGVGIEYELRGKAGDPAVALTPGGRFPGNSPGFPELADKLAASGRRVLIWDRPNCGASDISFNGTSESELGAHTLTQLIRKLELGKTALFGGSAGSRVSLIAASRDPEVVSHLIVVWVSGGILSLLSLAYYYCVDIAMAASKGGMEQVANLPMWALQIKRNPKNRDILLSMDAQKFVKQMEAWASFYLPTPDSPVPGMSPADFKKLTMPVMVYRSGVSDLSHTRHTSEWVAKLIPGAKLVEPPWGDTEWNDSSAYAAREGGGLGHFRHFDKLAPAILDFIKK